MTGVTLEKLAKISEKALIEQIFSGVEVPLAKERARLVREVCSTVLKRFNGSFVNVIKQANRSAVKLLDILTSHFPNFQDHQISHGHQIFFYNRAQILI